MKLNFKNNNVNALFFNTENSGGCSVYYLYSAVGGKKKPLISISRYYSTYLIDREYKDQTDFLKEKKIRNADMNKLIVVANKDRAKTKLSGFQNASIDHDWFDKTSKKSLLVLFTPGGAKLLKHPNWSSKFPNWVSFAEHFHFMTGLPALETERKILFPRLFSAILDEQNAKALKEKFSAIFEEAQNRINEKDDNDDDNLALAYILGFNRENLEHS